ncbi:MAG: S9 family peptidase, partial [Candidatus Aminicenantes bacterium]|nr:S9 family peptidase [Candidatus Aminicenantes bacterium]
KKSLAIDDYSKWKSIGGQAISNDGKWVAYTLALTNTTRPESKPVLHIRNLDSGSEVTVAHATGGVFSPDSKWIAYQVDPGAAQRARAGRSGPGGAAASAPSTPAPQTQPTTPPATPSGQAATSGAQAGRGGAPAAIPPRRVEIRNLATGEIRSFQDIQSFTFSPLSTHLFLRRRPSETESASGRSGGTPTGPMPGAFGRRPGGGGSAVTRGLDVVLFDLRTGKHILLGSVGDIVFNRTGELLAYTVESTVKDGNGLFIYDTRNGRTTTLDNDAKTYNRMAWNDGGTAIAVLKTETVEKMREKANVLLAFPDVPAVLKDGAPAPVAVVFDPAKVETFPKGYVASERAALSWSEDGKRVFFGMKDQGPAAPESSQRKSTDEAADVDVWNTGDERVQSAQMIRADRERNFTFTQAFDVTAGGYIKLADETMRELNVAPDGKWAIGMDTRGYIHDFKPAAADVYRVDTATGERTLIAKNMRVERFVFGLNPHGTHFLYWKDAKIHAYDLAAGASTVLGAGKVVFVDMEWDYPGVRPSYGIAGYTSDGKAVIAQHRYDLWLVPLDGSAPKNLTNGLGSKNEIRFRILRPVPDDPTKLRADGPRSTIDLSRPVLLSAYGEWTKKSGYYELTGGEMKELVYEDASFSPPVRAMNADTYLFTRQTYVEFPDLRVSGPDFKDVKTISEANPQQAEFKWGKQILFDFKNKDGKRLQGVLAIPDDYKPGEKRPMIVTFYEKNSQTLHRYPAPAYMVSMGRMPVQAVTEGFLTMLPDVHFRTGSSHSDMLECVEAGTQKVIEMGYADPKRIGVTGHSYGGEGAAYIATKSRMFAAVGMGAGVVDLYNDFNMNWGWTYQAGGGSGETAFDYYYYSQGRWGFSPWDRPDRYRSESALSHAPAVTAPVLIMHGTADPTVGFINGLAFYNALRFNGKKAVLLAYPNERHHLAGLANQKDLTTRFMEFFNHFLKGAPAPKWLTEGVPFLKKNEPPADKK